MAVSEREFFVKLENLEHLPEFLHECVNCFSAQKTPNFDIDCSGDTEWSQEELARTREKIQNFFRQNAFSQKFSLPSDLSENVKSAFENVSKIRHKDILNSIIKENLINNGHNLVENLDWKLKWILGSSKLSILREPVCQVELRYASAEKGLMSKKVIHFEANLEKLDEIISLLNNVKNELNGL